MPKNDENKHYENLLPNYKDLKERSLMWGALINKIENNLEKDEVEEIAFDFELRKNDSVVSSESVDPTCYEDKLNNTDPTFDVQDTLSKTKPFIEKQNKTIQKFGIEGLMDTFNLDKINCKVDKWLKNDNNFFSIGSKYINQELRIANLNFSDNESASSVDTAKYILSSRKRNRSKVTTMTIKQYCCYSTRALKNTEKLQTLMKKQPRSEPGDAHFRGRLKLNDKKMTSKKACRSQSYSSVSSKSLSPLKQFHSSKNSQKFSPKCHSKIFNKPRKLFDNIPSGSSTDSPCRPPKKNFKKQQKKRLRKEVKLENENSPKKSDFSMQRNFDSGNMINSTAINKTMEKNCIAKKIPEIQEVIELSDSSDSLINVKNNQVSKIKNNITPILIYSPNRNSKLKDSIVNGEITLTADLLKESIGQNLAKQYLNNSTDFVSKFDAKSIIWFYPPENILKIIESSDSEPDFLSKNNFVNTTGRIEEFKPFLD